VGFEPTIPVFKLAKISHALDHVATVIGIKISLPHENIWYSQRCEMTTAIREGM
jgi:hypothetical protein